MKTVQDNIADIEELCGEVRKHCLTVRFLESEDNYTVLLPPGYAVDVVRVGKRIGKGKALRLVLEKLEFYWESSFPGYVAK